jgi:hypothetical protein
VKIFSGDQVDCSLHDEKIDGEEDSGMIGFLIYRGTLLLFFD